MEKLLKLTIQDIDNINNLDDAKSLIKDFLVAFKDIHAKLKTDSTNSHKPSSQMPYYKPSPKSLREKSGKDPWGQVWHDWVTLLQNKMPDARVYVQKTDEATTMIWNKFQVIDIEIPKTVCTEYIITNKETVPSDTIFIDRKDIPHYVKSNIQYWPNIRALWVYMMCHMMVSCDRTAQFFEEVFGITMSVATIKSFEENMYNYLEKWFEYQLTKVQYEAVAYGDESWWRVNGKTWWFHVVATYLVSLFFYNSKRGQEAIDRIWFLKEFNGIFEHDCWAPYFKYMHIQHAICNVHLLRELQWVIDHEAEGKERATKMRAHVLHIKSLVDTAKSAWLEWLSLWEIGKLTVEYDNMCSLWLGMYKPVVRTNKAGKTKQAKWKNLLDRFVKYKTEILRFAHNFLAPFGNNLAEQAIRMNKVKMKVSWCFRSEDWIRWFTRNRSFIATMQKQGMSTFLSLKECFSDWYNMLVI